MLLMFVVSIAISLLLGMLVVCKNSYTKVCSVGRVKMGYVAVRRMTIAYRMANHRAIPWDSRLLSLVKHSKVTYINILYTLYGQTSNSSTYGPYYEGCDSMLCAVGIVLNEDETDINEEKVKLITDLGYRIYTLPCIYHALSAVYSVQNNEPPGAVIQRIMPVVQDIINEHQLCAYPQFEIFDSSHVQIIMPLSRQISYFVPEAVPRSPYQWYLNSVVPYDSGVVET